MQSLKDRIFEIYELKKQVKSKRAELAELENELLELERSVYCGVVGELGYLGGVVEVKGKGLFVKPDSENIRVEIYEIPKL